MRELKFTVPSECNGILLKSFLRKKCGVSARLLARLKRTPNGIMCNGMPAIATDILFAGDRISILQPQDDKMAEPVPLPFSIVYEDEDLLIVDKPAAMPMYPKPGHNSDSLANAAAYYWLQQNSFFSFRPAYRLDKDTSGLIVLSKNSYAASMMHGCIRKTYFAVCEGRVSGSGEINLPIGLKDGHSIQREIRTDGLCAVTRWRSLYSGEGYSFLAIRLKTGRTHQIRVHFSGLGHPLAGDDMYGGNLELITRQALHCGMLRLVHPVTGKRLRFVSPFPADMRLLIDNLIAKQN